MEGLYPSAAVPLHLFHHFGYAGGVRQQEQDVNVVANTTYAHDLASCNVRHTPNVAVYTRHILFANRGTRGLDMEYEVYIYLT